MITSKRINEQEVTARDGARIRYERTGRRTDADLCSLRRTERGKQVGGAAGRTRTILEAARASTKTCTERATELRRGEQGEKRPKSVRQHFVLSARDSYFFLNLLLL